jgi:hypothetical protein
MAGEAPLEQTETGTIPTKDGWFVLNACDARWLHAPGRGAYSKLEGDLLFNQIGMHLCILEPGEPMAMYHWEFDQEDFLVISGDALLVVEGEERPLGGGTSFTAPPVRSTPSSERARPAASSSPSGRATVLHRKNGAATRSTRWPQSAV